MKFADLAAGVIFWIVALMAFSMAFAASWNAALPKKFGLQPINSLDSLCILLCIWIAGRVAIPMRSVTVRSVKE